MFPKREGRDVRTLSVRLPACLSLSACLFPSVVLPSFLSYRGDATDEVASDLPCLEIEVLPTSTLVHGSARSGSLLLARIKLSPPPPSPTGRPQGSFPLLRAAKAGPSRQRRGPPARTPVWWHTAPDHLYSPCTSAALEALYIGLASDSRRTYLRT